MKYDYTIKRNEVLIYATWMNVENMLSEIKLYTKEQILYDSMYFSEVPRIGNFTVTGSRLEVTRSWEREDWESLLNG